MDGLTTEVTTCPALSSPPLEHDPHVGVELRDGGEARISIAGPGWTGRVVTSVCQPEEGDEAKLLSFVHALAQAYLETNKERVRKCKA